MPQPRVEIPKISNRRLGYLARIIRPVVSLHALPLGKYPQDNIETYYLKIPKNLRGFNFLKEQRVGKPIRLARQAEIRTFHEPGSAGRVFHPTIAEVLAQIPAHYLDPKNPPGCRIVAFETYLENYDPEYDESGHLHVAKTVLLTKGSPYTGALQRAHYS